MKYILVRKLLASLYSKCHKNRGGDKVLKLVINGINTEPISVQEINQLKKENELLGKEVVYFIKKYMETRALLQEGLELLDCFEKQLCEVEDKLFWVDEVRRLQAEGLQYKDALEVANLEEKIQKILRKKGGN